MQLRGREDPRTHSDVPKVLGCFDRWPWPGEHPRVRPESRDEKMRYLHELMESPAAFKEYLEVTKYLSKICLRD